MIIFKVNERMDKIGLTRYRLQQLTNWNYRRVNSYYQGKVINMNVEELDKLCTILDCKIDDLIVYQKEGEKEPKKKRKTNTKTK